MLLITNGYNCCSMVFKTVTENTIIELDLTAKYGFHKYNRRALAKLYSTFCDNSVFYASGLFPLLNNGNLKRIQINYFKFCKFLLYLQPWAKNRTLVRKFSVPDITLKLEILHKKLSSTASAHLSLHHRFIRFFG